MVHNKGDLAVLHNRNKMVNTNTEWVSGSGGAIISRSVTSSAGMTVFLVLLAQTRVGFLLSGGRGNKLPKKKRPMRGLQLLSPERNRFASSWALWTCNSWELRPSSVT